MLLSTDNHHVQLANHLLLSLVLTYKGKDNVNRNTKVGILNIKLSDCVGVGPVASCSVCVTTHKKLRMTNKILSIYENS